MTELTDVLKREHEDAEICHICLRVFDDHKNNQKLEIIVTIQGYTEVLRTTTAI